MRFRHATDSDLDELIEFYGRISDAMIGTPHDCMWRRGNHPGTEMLMNAVSAGTLTVSEDNGTIASAVIVNHVFEDPTSYDLPWLIDCSRDEALVVHVLATAPEYRGAGIARDLLFHVIDTARSQNMRSMRLEVAENNTPAVKLYESCGFIPIIVVKRFWGSRLVDAVAMEHPL